MPQTPRHRLILPLAVALAAAPITHAYDSTAWTGGANNGLWADSLNWSNGLPTAGPGQADVSRASGVVDLGGITRDADSVLLSNSSTRLTNGTLALNYLEYNGTGAPGVVATVAATLTTRAPTLRLSAVNAIQRLRIEGPIAGDDFVLRPAHVALAGANTYTGPTIVAEFSDTLLLDNGSATRSSRFDLGHTLQLNNGSVNVNDRLNDAAPLRFFGGTLSISGNAAAPTTERVGLLQFVADGGTIALSHAAGQLLTLRAPSIDRQPHNLATISAELGTSARLLLDAPPSLVGAGVSPVTRGVVPWLTTQGIFDRTLKLVTYDVGDPLDPADDIGLRPLDPVTECAAALPATPLDVPANVRLTAAVARDSDATVNSLVFGSKTARVTLANDATLRVNSGVVLGGSIDGSGTLEFPGEGILHGTTVDVPIRARSLTLADTDATFSRPVDAPDGVEVAGYLTLRGDANLGTGPVRFINGSKGGHLTIDGSRTLPNDISFGRAAFTLSDGLWIQTTPIDPTRFQIPAGQTLTLTGKLSGHTAGFEIRGGGNLRIDGEAAFSSLAIDMPGLSTLELNGVLGPADHAPRPFDLIRMTGKLRGNGALIGAFDGGDLAPGAENRPGRLTINTVSGADLAVDLDGPTPATDYDQLIILTALDHLGKLTVDLTYTPVPGQSFLILDNRSPLASDPFTNLPEGATLLANNTLLQISYSAGDGNDISLTTLPEPTTLLPFAAAAFALFPRRRQRKLPG